ncbi:MAG: cysteine desulfurase [Polyangiaceae bacterium]|nr:cysteine desulfurase [Polyangiaceae bacterium]
MHDADPIYLDHNATTPLLPEVFDAMVPWLRDGFGNPSSGHVYGRRAKSAVENARAQVAELLGCSSDEILFTSGGTEANNLAIRGIAEAYSKKKHVVTSVIEHPATAKPCAYLTRNGYRVDDVGVDALGQVRIDEIASKLGADTCLVTIMHSNNETGVLQPIAAISKVTRSAGTLLHTDAAQSAGKVPTHVDELGVDLLSIAGHKLYAPKGVGALFVRKGISLSPLLLGAGHERGLRPGTENVASIVGLGTACVIAKKNLAKEAKRVQVLRDNLFERLRDRVPGLALNGHPVERLPNTLSVRFPGVSGTALLSHAPGIAASTGSACHDGHESASSVMTAMGVRPDEALGTVRLTLGRGTTEAHVTRAAELLSEAWSRLFGPPRDG